jgi:hypothetical protein
MMLQYEPQHRNCRLVIHGLQYILEITIDHQQGMERVFQQENLKILIFGQDFEDSMQYHFLQTEQDTSHILVPHKKVHLLEIDSGDHCH